MLDFAHVFARALNNVAHVFARARNNVAHESARTRNSRTFYVANVPAYGIAVCLCVCLSVCQYVRRLSVAVRHLSIARGLEARDGTKVLELDVDGGSAVMKFTREGDLILPRHRRVVEN
eukprot:scaffold44550_cov53-Attheya_sp.AAC.2